MTAAAPQIRRGSRQRILVVEDEPDIRELLRFNLTQEGFTVGEAPDGATALESVAKERPELVVLDIMLPGMSGLEICRALRAVARTSDLPIIFLTARISEVDRVLGLEMGADDYVVKPFSPRELVARIRALLRRATARITPESGGALERGYLKVDLGTYEVFVDGKRRDFCLREFELLRFFVEHPGRVY